MANRSPLDDVKIVALIGPSGTGKSHRASMVAVEKGLDTIIDDGLLIHAGRIVAGHSAKREATRVAAVRRAILADPDHARAIKEGLLRLSPQALLVLGTSENMIRRILDALDLSGAFVQWMRIEEITSEDERALARQIRRNEGKHVIPAPTMEVKKSFSGYLVDPLRFIFRGKGRQMEVEKSIVRPTYSSLGRFYIADTVLTALVVHVARQVEGIARVTRVVVQSSPEGVRIQLEVILAQSVQLFSILARTQSQVAYEIEQMTSLNVLRVRIDARRVLTDY